MNKHHATKVELTAKERTALRRVLDKFYNHLSQDGAPILMSEEDTELIKELGDLAKDICITNY